MAAADRNPSTPYIPPGCIPVRTWIDASSPADVRDCLAREPLFATPAFAIDPTTGHLADIGVEFWRSAAGLEALQRGTFTNSRGTFVVVVQEGVLAPPPVPEDDPERLKPTAIDLAEVYVPPGFTKVIDVVARDGLVPVRDRLAAGEPAIGLSLRTGELTLIPVEVWRTPDAVEVLETGLWSRKKGRGGMWTRNTAFYESFIILVKDKPAANPPEPVQVDAHPGDGEHDGAGRHDDGDRDDADQHDDDAPAKTIKGWMNQEFRKHPPSQADLDNPEYAAILFEKCPFQKKAMQTIHNYLSFYRQERKRQAVQRPPER